MISYSACAPTDHDGAEDGWDMAVATQADVDRLVAALADTAHIESDTGEFVAQAAIEDGLGYLFYVDLDGGAYSLGEPTSPELASAEQQFPAGSGVAIERLAAALAALAELLTAPGRPRSISWQLLEAVVAHRTAS